MWRFRPPQRCEDLGLEHEFRERHCIRCYVEESTARRQLVTA